MNICAVRKGGVRYIRGTVGNFFDAPLRMRPESLKEPDVAAVVASCRRRLDGSMQQLRLHAPIQTAWQTHKAFGNGGFLRVS